MKNLLTRKNIIILVAAIAGLGVGAYFLYSRIKRGNIAQEIILAGTQNMDEAVNQLQAQIATLQQARDNFQNQIVAILNGMNGNESQANSYLSSSIFPGFNMPPPSGLDIGDQIARSTGIYWTYSIEEMESAVAYYDNQIAQIENQISQILTA